MYALAVTVVALISLGAFANPAKAADFTVTNTDDSGDGSLRDAMKRASDTWDEADNITFLLPQGPNTITLASRLPSVGGSGDVVIDGGEAEITVSGDGKTSLISVGGKLTLRNLTLTKGFSEDLYWQWGQGGAIFNWGTVRVEGCTFSENRVYSGGGAIYNDYGGTLTVVDSVFSGNSAGYTSADGPGYSAGGAIFNHSRLRVEGSTFSGNSARGSGGAIQNYRTLTVVDSAFSNNSANSFGGGIRNSGGTLAVDGSTFSGNSSTASFGGGIYSNGGALTVDGSTFSGNSAYLGGGGIMNQGALTVNGSTFSGNSAAAYGGGIYSRTDAVTATAPSPQMRATTRNSTLSGNSAGADGGGIYNETGLAVLENATITKNTAPEGQGSGVSSYTSSIVRTEVSSSIISANTNSDVDLKGGSLNTFQSNGHNLIGGGNATGAFGKDGDQTGVPNPGLGDLADNGGPTKTHALLPGSPATDAGDPAFGPTPEFDQRGAGFPRIQYGRVDIGAFEVGDTVPPQLELPADITKTATSSSGTTVSYQQPTATDAVDGDLPVECSPASGSTFPPGTTTVSCSATDRAGNKAEGTFEVTVLLDEAAPAVVATTPAGKNVARTANVTATFSEAMDEASVESAGTVKLVKKGTTRAVAAAVTYEPATKKATLDPNKSLTGGATYRATVSTGAKDSAGNALAANKTWSFRVKG